MKENKFWAYVKSHFDKRGILSDRIEPVSQIGIADVNAICPETGTEVWIELKSEDGYDIKIKPWQTKWAQRRTTAGSRCFLLVRRVTAKVDQIELMCMIEGVWRVQLILQKESNKFDMDKLITTIFRSSSDENNIRTRQN